MESSPLVLTTAHLSSHPEAAYLASASVSVSLQKHLGPAPTSPFLAIGLHQPNSFARRYCVADFETIGREESGR